jgi:hypothetical protein
MGRAEELAGSENPCWSFSFPKDVLGSLLMQKLKTIQVRGLQKSYGQIPGRRKEYPGKNPQQVSYYGIMFHNLINSVLFPNCQQKRAREPI